MCAHTNSFEFCVNYLSSSMSMENQPAEWNISNSNIIFNVHYSNFRRLLFPCAFFFVSASIIAPTPKSNIYEVRLAIGNQRRSKKLCFNSNNNTTTTARTDCVNDGVVYLLGITNEFLFAYKLNITSSL